MVLKTEYEDNPLLFWKENSSLFPLLSQLASVYLGTSASSVPVESLFSTTGLILNGKRCSLTPDELNMIVFIHDNFDRIVEAAANDTAEDGGLKVIDRHSTTASAAVTLSTEAAPSTAVSRTVMGTVTIIVDSSVIMQF